MSFYGQFNEIEIDILRERANRLASQMSGAADLNTLAALRIRLGREWYAFSLDELVTIIEHVTVIPVPCVPSFIAGVANVRGKIMPVLDLAQWLGVALANDEISHHLLIASNLQMSMAFRISQIGDLLVINRNEIQPLPVDFDALHPQAFIGLTKDNYILINTNAILTSDSIRVDERMA